MKFSLKSALFFVACAAGYFGIAFSLPIRVTFLSLCVLSFFAPGVFAAGVVYGKGALRAFALGCLIGAIPLVGYLCLITVDIADITKSLLHRAELDEANVEGLVFGVIRATQIASHLLIAHAFVAANGLSVVACRWLLQRHAE